MNIPSFLTFSKRISVCAFVLMAMAIAVSAQKDGRSPEAASVDQCHNGAFGGPVQPCSYVNGNSHGGNSQWIENEFIAYRVVNSDFAPNTVGATMTIGYDTTVGNQGKHAIDYLGTYNFSQTTAEGNNPCQPLASCPGTPDTFAFPIDPNVTGAGVTQIPGELTVWGCDITGMSGYTLNGTYAGQSQTTITVTFNVGPSGTCYFAWGGHIASRLDWGPDNSAVAINGSPYHMNVNGGADRQLKVEAQGFPAKLTIIKQIGDTQAGSSFLFFGFDRSDVGTPGTADFFLQDDNNNADGSPDRITIDYPLAVGQTASVSITELPPGFGWAVSDIYCVDSSGGLGFTANSTPQVGNYVSGSTAVANLQEAEFVTCTFENLQGTATAAPASIGGRVTNSAGRGLSGVDVALTDLSTGAVRTARTNSFGYYLFDNVETTLFYSLSASSKRYAFRDGTKYFTLNEDSLDMNFVSAN